VNRLLKLATCLGAEQPIFSVDKRLIGANLKALAKWPRLQFILVPERKTGAIFLRPFYRFFWP
jgi:hypothetical protein